MPTGATANSHASSPVGRGGAGAYIEGELGAFYMLALLADAEPRGLPGARIQRLRFQGVDDGFSLDDLVVHGLSNAGPMILEIQSKRTITFAPKDTVFAEVCGQIARSSSHGIPEDRHRLAVATQRTSKAISGAYQDVLEWARKAESGTRFFKRLETKGVSSSEMRTFADTFRTNLVAAGVEDDDDVVWRHIRRFLILEFDFESSAPLARTHGLYVARQILAPENMAQAEVLWDTLIAVSLEQAKAGACIDRADLRALLAEKNFRLVGARDFSTSKLKLTERTRQALAEIGDNVAGIQLPRRNAVRAIDTALDHHRFVEIRGGPGVGKSAVLKQIAERVARQANVLVLDPVSTPKGGWPVLAQTLSLDAPARDFLTDLATSGGGTIFIDSLEMFTCPERRRTVNDLLREIAMIDGFSVVVTARSDFGAADDNWLAPELTSLLGPAHTVTVGELEDNEVEMLRAEAPGLRALLAPGHAAAAIARNLYRLSRLLNVHSTDHIRTEAALASHWWGTADTAELADRRAAQRLIADLADAAIVGNDSIEVRDDSSARSHLLRSRTLSEPRRDHLRFYHDVLRDWAVGARVHENANCIDRLDLRVPASPRVARGIEFAGRFKLERSTDCGQWLALLERLSVKEAHSSWRRQALLAIVRSELSANLLERCSAELLAQEGELLVELCLATATAETASPSAITNDLIGNAAAWASSLPEHFRLPVTPAVPRLVSWCVDHASEIPLRAISPVVKLVQTLLLLIKNNAKLAEPIAAMLFTWLRQLDEKRADVRIPSGGRALSVNRNSLISELRTISLLLCAHAPEQTKAYLRAIRLENDRFKIKDVRLFSATIASIAPQELADLVASSLIESHSHRDQSRRHRYDTFGFNDGDYLPPSPAQTPFLDLLQQAPGIGLNLVRRLVDEAVAFRFGGVQSDHDGYVLVFDGHARFFPWKATYFWSRDQALDYSVASALMAMEAWGHGRVESGDPLDAVIADILGPDGSCAAYLLVAVDLLLSNWPSSRELLVPFVASPELLATERGRPLHNRAATVGSAFGKEPVGRIQLADLASKPSRRVVLESLLPHYLGDDTASALVRSALKDATARIGPYTESSNFGDPAFMGAHALNLLDARNWVTSGERREYRSPSDEAEHIARLGVQQREHSRSVEIESKIQLAIHDPSQGSTAIARQSVEFANGELPTAADSDVLHSRATRLAATAVLVARDGDDLLLDEHEQWVRQVITATLAEKVKGPCTASSALAYNRQALAVLGLVHLWRRRRLNVDRNALVRIAARRDGCAVPAFLVALDVIAECDLRMLKSAVRLALKTSRVRRNAWDDNADEVSAYELEKKESDFRAADAEIAWLDGGAEPSWPAFPEEHPIPRRRTRLSSAHSAEGGGLEHGSSMSAKPSARAHVDTHAAAQWLSLVTRSDHTRKWYSEMVRAYSSWTARANGFGLSRDVAVDHAPTAWNDAFYVLVANELMDVDSHEFRALLHEIEMLPDESFGDIAETVLLVADICYFNDPSRSAARPAELRYRLVKRTLNLRHWNRDLRPQDLSVDMGTAGIVARLLFNTHNPLGGTASYLVPAVFDRIDPLLDSLRPLLPGGPTPFIALCTMNALLTAPRARQIGFVLEAAEAWLERLPRDAAMWVDLGIGRRIVDWMNAAVVDDPLITARAHPMRSRVDILVGRLVGLGVPGSYELEQRLEQVE